MIENLRRATDLGNMPKRMGGVSGEFGVRSETVGAGGFLAFFELATSKSADQ